MAGAEGGGTIALVADLMFASKIRGAAAAVGAGEVATLRTAEAVFEAAQARRPDVILLDLDARGVDAPALISRLKSDPNTAASRLICFVSHVNADAIESARAAGADRVLARSAFVRELPGLLSGTA